MCLDRGESNSSFRINELITAFTRFILKTVLSVLMVSVSNSHIYVVSMIHPSTQYRLILQRYEPFLVLLPALASIVCVQIYLKLQR